MESTFFAVILFGLYWKRANKYGAIASMYLGFLTYIICASWFDNPFGMHAVATALFVNVSCMVVVSYLTKGPNSEIINLFWGSKPNSQVKTTVGSNATN